MGLDFLFPYLSIKHTDDLCGVRNVEKGAGVFGSFWQGNRNYSEITIMLVVFGTCSAGKEEVRGGTLSQAIFLLAKTDSNLISVYYQRSELFLVVCSF